MANEITAIQFKQWLDEWEAYEFDDDSQRRKPEPHAYLFAMSAVQLRSLSGVYRRKRDDAAAEGVQRRHDEKRSGVIRDFVRYGYPYSSLPKPLRNEANELLRKPGWLPTAIVVNILRPEDDRRGKRVHSDDVVSLVSQGDKTCKLKLPYGNPSERWVPQELEPFEVIDGQHRLWAFDEAIRDGTLPDDFELPVVAFRGLDVGWQAYLFWSINVSPKRINPSHAFDLFPLLRSAGWLDTFSELKIYREARAQELVELLYAHPESPWQGRINMLGDNAKNAPPRAGVTQAGWVRALTASFLSPGGGRATMGLFGAAITRADGPLDWPRALQAALLIELWAKIEAAVAAAPAWTTSLNDNVEQDLIDDGLRPAFNGPRTILNQEQGVRGVLSVANDLLVYHAKRNRAAFERPSETEAQSQSTIEDVSEALHDIRQMAASGIVGRLAAAMATFDWRSADAPGLSEEERFVRRAYRGSSGYVALRQKLSAHLAQSEFPDIAEAALAAPQAGA